MPVYGHGLIGMIRAVAAKEAGSKGSAKRRSPKKSPPAKRGARRRRARPEKWQIVENVVAALERVQANVPGTKVEQKALLGCLADPKDTREIDVLVTIPASGRALQIGIDVKNEARALSTESLGTLIEKRDEVGLGTYYVVSTAGFSEPAKRKAARRGVHLLKLEEFVVSDFWHGPLGHHLIRTSIKHVQFNFAFSETTLAALGDSLSRRLRPATYDNTVLHDAGGSMTLRQFVNGPLTKDAQDALKDVADGDYVFPVSVAMDSCTKVTVQADELPLPIRADLVVTASRTTETLPEVRFRLGPIEVSTVQMDLFGERKQVSIVAVPKPTGERQLVFTHGPANPPKTKPI